MLKKFKWNQWWRVLLGMIMLVMVLGACQSQKKTVTESSDQESVMIKVPSGAEVEVPKGADRIISLAPSITQVIDDLGEKNKLIAVDTQSPNYVSGLEDISHFDMMLLDLESILALKPQVIFVTSMTTFQSSGELEKLKNEGVAVIEIPTENTLAQIQDDIQIIGNVFGASKKADKIVSEMKEQIAEIKAIGETVKEKKTVLFEIAASPEIYSMAGNTYLDEMITTIGAVNMLKDEEGAVKVEEEAAVAANPDVILTNVNYMPNPVEDILNAAAWQEVSAVKNKEVYYIDNGTSSLPNQHVVEAMKQMAKAVYPDAFKKL